MGRSRRDGAMWARIGRRGGTDPLEAGRDAEYLPLDPDSGALIVQGAGVVPTATALRVQDGDSTRTALVGADRALLVRDVTAAEAMVATAQEPGAPLTAGEVFVGPWDDVLAYAAITVTVLTDQPSAVQGAVVEFSEDAVTVIRSVPTTIPANFPAYFSLAPEARYVRFRYTNGPTAQSSLQVQVLYRYQPPAVVEQPLGSVLTDANIGQVVRATVAGRKADGTYGPIATTSDGRLLVDVGQTAALTDSQLRAAPVPVDTGLVIPQPQTDALTDAQLRATRVPVDVEHDQPLTDTQLAARGLATNAALVPLLDSVEALLTAVRDRLPPTAHEQPLTAAQAMTTPVRVREGLAFYASPQGGRVAFNTTTDIQTINSTGEQPLAALVNPIDSGVDFLLWYGEFSTSANADLRRYRGATVGSFTAASQAWANMGGGTATNPLRFQRAGTYTGTGGIVSKTAQIGTRIHYPAEEHFAVRLSPGQATRWTIVGPGGLGGTMTAAIYLAGAIVPAGT